MAVVPDLAWSLDGDDAYAVVVDFPADLPESDDEPLPDDVERYSWWSVWRRAALLVVVAAALAAGIVFVLHDWREWVPTATAPQSPTADSAAFLKEEEVPNSAPDPDPNSAANPEVCRYIRAGRTVQQTIEDEQHDNSLTPEQARAYVDASVNAYCPELSGSAARH